ncbi:MAG: InlB B-repeat-containing protein [Ilumatobacteraceae bacterium]
MRPIRAFNGSASLLTVSFDAQGGSAVASESSSVGGQISAPSDSTTRAGFTLTGWFTASSGGTAITFPYTHGQTADFTLYAQWTLNTYVVSFDGNGSTGGSVPSDQTKTHGVDLTVASNSGSLVREGFTFAGWNSQADGDGTAYAGGATYTTDVGLTLYAQWTGDLLTVTYDAQGGSAVSDGSSVSGGSVAEAPESPALADHTFGGWFASASGGTAITFPYTHGQTADFTLYAQWTLNTYVVSFDGNGSTGGSVPSDQTKTHGVDLTVASNSGSLVREGFTFAGWNSQADGDGTAYAGGATYTTDVGLTLYAQWTGDPLTVTYDAQGGSAVSDGLSVSGGSVAEAPDTPIRAGFTFVGWFVASIGGAAVSFPYPHGQNADFTLYAQWVQSSLYGLGSVTKIGTITTVDGVGNTFSADASSSSVSLRYPADGLPASTVIDVYLVNDLSRAQGLVSDDGNFIVSLVVAWLAADGTVPSTATGKPLSMTITNSTILAGAKTYAIMNGQVTLLGTAEVDGSVTISITDDPEIVVVNPSSSPTTTAPPTTTSPPPAGGGGGGSGAQPPSSVQPPSTIAPPSASPAPPAQPSVDVISSLPTTDLFVPTVVFPGQPVTVVHSGFTPGEVVDAYVASTPQLVGSATTDENGRVELTVAIPAGLSGQHSLVLFEPSSGMMVRQEISIGMLALPVTGPSETSNDLVVSLALFLLVFGVLGREINRKTRTRRP